MALFAFKPMIVASSFFNYKLGIGINSYAKALMTLRKNICPIKKKLGYI
jgi:hypothetical protein